MFTGLIEQTGTVGRVISKGNYLVITVIPETPFEGVVDGESIAVSGPCLTVVSHDERSFTVEASQETVQVTTLGTLRAGNRVNLERALRADARLGGHFVSGHIDCTLNVLNVNQIGNSLQVTVELPSEYEELVVDKGSVALDGISLTVARVDDDGFMVNIIPETQRRTTWRDIRAGDMINVEFDMIGKYIRRFLDRRPGTGTLTIESMRKMGY